MDTLYSFYAPVAPVFSSSPIWMLGKQYAPETPATSSESSPSSSTSSLASSSSSVSSAPFSRFLDDYNQKVWFSYRKDFPPIENSTYTTDAGWGCMLRSGQMMLAQAFIYHKLGRGWSINKGDPVPPEIFEIIRLFGDNPTPAHPYSIHDIARVGQKYGKTIGDWFAPSTISLSLAELVSLHKPYGLRVVVSEDGGLYLDKIAEACAPTPNDNTTPWKGAVILVPLRLGLDTMNAVYYPPILELFQIPQSLGIIGGKPRASLYFIAAQDDYVFYLDPHVIQATVNTDDEFSIDTFHTTCTRKMHVSEIDPSLALAFYCKDKPDLDDFCHRIEELTGKYKDGTLFTISHKAPDYHSSSSLNADEEEEIEMDMDMVVL